MKFAKFIAIFAFLFIQHLTTTAVGFPIHEFKRLAHQMVDDIEKAYGPVMTDRGVSFSTQRYHEIIDRTKIEISLKPIENVYYADDGNGSQTLVREKNLDAQNFFPTEERVIYFLPIWEKKFREKLFNEIKVMIHHEFVPYFTGTADRSMAFNKKVEDIYKPKLTWQSLESGFYEVMLSDHPSFDLATKAYWYHLHISQNSPMFLLEIVENPRRDYWCIPCFYAANTMEMVWHKFPVVLLDRVSKILKTPFGEMEGIPYIQVLSKTSFMLSVAEKANIPPGTGNLEERLAQSKQNGIVFEKVTDLKNLSWRKPKKFQLPGVYWGYDRSCTDQIEKYKRDLQKACETFGKMPGVGLSRRDCDRDLKITITDQTGRQPFEKFSCSFTAEGEIPAPPGFNPTPQEPRRSEQQIRIWEDRLQQAIQKSNSGKE